MAHSKDASITANMDYSSGSFHWNVTFIRLAIIGKWMFWLPSILCIPAK